MNKLRTIIVDDEQDARENLSLMLGKYCPQVQIDAEATNVKEATALISQIQPDLVFLDIQMPDGNGLDLLESIGPDSNFEVIFVTAYDEYAIRAIKFSALDYLLKPIDITELKSAVEKAVNKSADKVEQVQTLIENRKALSRICLSTQDGLTFAEITDIIRCESEGSYTTFHFKDADPLVVSRSLKEYEEMLRECDFFRTHQSHLINLHHVKKFLKGSGGQVLMVDGTELLISRRKKDELLERLMAMQ